MRQHGTDQIRLDWDSSGWVLIQMFLSLTVGYWRSYLIQQFSKGVREGSMAKSAICNKIKRGGHLTFLGHIFFYFIIKILTRNFNLGSNVIACNKPTLTP